MKRSFSLLTLTATSLILHAEDLTIQPARFEHTLDLDSTALPLQVSQTSISPKVYFDFVIDKVLPHGSKVKKGDKLIWIDTEKLDTLILETEKSRAIDSLNLAQLEQELDELQLITERDLNGADITFERAKQDYAHFNEVELPMLAKELDFQRRKSSWGLDYTKEELDQLLKMYASDGLTEETEEIIIKRAKNDFARAQFEHNQVNQAVKHELEVTIPRKKQDADRTFESAKQNWQFTRQKLERQLKIKQASLVKARLEDANKQTILDKLKQDRLLADITAPQDGTLYYGEFTNGTWNTENAKKALIPQAKLMPHTPLLTVVPDSSPLQLHAMVDGSIATKIKTDLKGSASLPSSSLERFPAEVHSVATTPNTQNKWDILITPSPTENTPIFPGSPVKIHLTTYVNENAISLPSKAIKTQPDGTHAVMLKMADGNTALKPVTLGLTSGDKVEILTGLEAGQVIVYDK